MNPLIDLVNDKMKDIKSQQELLKKRGIDEQEAELIRQQPGIGWLAAIVLPSAIKNQTVPYITRRVNDLGEEEYYPLFNHHTDPVHDLSLYRKSESIYVIESFPPIVEGQQVRLMRNGDILKESYDGQKITSSDTVDTLPQSILQERLQ